RGNHVDDIIDRMALPAAYIEYACRCVACRDYEHIDEVIDVEIVTNDLSVTPYGQHVACRDSAQERRDKPLQSRRQLSRAIWIGGTKDHRLDPVESLVHKEVLFDGYLDHSVGRDGPEVVTFWYGN